MFGFLSPKLPLTTRQRAEIDLLMRKAIEHVGADTVRNASVLTDVTKLPIDTSSRESVFATADMLVKKQMGLEKQYILLSRAPADEIDAAGLYYAGNPPTIVIADETLDDPLRTVAVLAHEYSHHVLLSPDDASSADADERLTDLLPVCYGLGIMASDAAFYDRNWSSDGMSGYRMSSSGYVGTLEIGYALALFARFRGETNPDWSRFVRLDSREPMKKTLRYFATKKKRDEPILFDTPRIPKHTSTPQELNEWLRSDDPAFALAASWCLTARNQITDANMDSILYATHSKDEDVAEAAVGLLAGVESNEAEIHARVKQLLRDRRVSVALAAARVANVMQISVADQIGTLAWLLEKSDLDVVIDLISACGKKAHHLDQQVCQEMVRALKDVDDQRASRLARCLHLISHDAQGLIKQTISDNDFRHEALDLISRAGALL